MKEKDSRFSQYDPATQLIRAGAGYAEHGFVNPAVYHASTVLFPDVETLAARSQAYVYGRDGTPTHRALEQAIAVIEGGHSALLCPSGMAAIATTLLSLVSAGDHVLMTDSVYRPARHFCETVLRRLGVETEYYDPLVGAGIERLIRPNTRLVYTEQPGSQTMEIQDIPAIAAAAHRAGALVVIDNTWATGRFFKAFAHGADVVVTAGTKYYGGHSDVMLGAIVMSEPLARQIDLGHHALGACCGPDDAYLALRGLRTLDVRLQQHMANALALAQWLEQRPEVDQVLYPALPGDPGHALWARDFTGASGLLSVILKPVTREAVAAMLDGLELFGMGYSWGGFESLIIPFDPRGYRTATRWEKGPALRIHVGLESVNDLMADLDAGFRRLDTPR
ncbi:cystathionine beta-lyase [Rhodoligotrophos defluvii]|uniref:cystathionine beta-lyase n=1 Tax=Rhodoligotrophos defluvii TaxID=2561934 RepID=UPI0010C9C782|nr:cystathionine beta-lyase [Rhodoligotrophos defluvii]